jgi:hypothetical protein
MLFQTAFGMNIKEFDDEASGTLGHYIAAAIPLTIFTIWIALAFQSRYFFQHNRPTSVWVRLAWPVLLYESLHETKGPLKTKMAQRITHP